MEINQYKTLLTSGLGYFSALVQAKEIQAVLTINSERIAANLQKVKIDE